MINALNSGARVFMADLEDALIPTWANVIGGQAALRDAVRRELDFDQPGGQGVPAQRARSRRWSSGRAAGTSTRRTCSSTARRSQRSLFDFGLYLFHNGRERSTGAAGRTSTCPSSRRARRRRLWNEVFVAAQEALGIPRGSIRATVLIETILAAFEMDEILYELRDHAAGLNAGRWDYLFSRDQEVPRAPGPGPAGPRPADDDHAVHARVHGAARPDVPPPRRARDRRHGGVHPVPPRSRGQRDGDGEGARRQASASRGDGFDGTWVAHPDLVPLATEIFDGVLGDRPNQKDAAARRGRGRGRADLLDLRVEGGRVTEAGVRAERLGRAPVPRRVAGRERRRGDQQPHGGRRDRRDQPLPALAVADDRHRARGRPAVDAALYAASATRSSPRSAAAGNGGSATRRTCSTSSSWPTSSPNS